MTINSLDKLYSFTDAKALMAQELKALPQSDGCYKEPFVKRIEIPVVGIDLLSWLSQQTSTIRIYGSHQTGMFSIAGVGEALTVSGDRIESYEKIFQRLRLYLTPQYNHLQFYGGFCFDENNIGSEWRSLGAYKFVIPQFELAVKGDRMIFCCNVIQHGQSTKTAAAIVEELNQLKWNEAPLKDVAVRLDTRRDNPNPDAWRRNVQAIEGAIERKECEKVVLARKTVFNFKEPLNPWLIMQQLKAVTPNSYHFCFQFESNRLFLGASPERLFARYQNAVESEAIAGTRPRGKNDDDDNRLKGELKSSGKERHEHQLVVDMIQKNLGALCEKFVVSEREILSVVNGHHLRTKMKGLLKDGINDAMVVEALHPTPAVGGVPTGDALELIRELEGFSRGWYAAPIGFVGLEQTEFVVAIRSALISDKQLTVYAGAGIVAGSTPKGEWQEIEHKIGNFLRVLNAKN